MLPSRRKTRGGGEMTELLGHDGEEESGFSEEESMAMPAES